MSINDQLGAVVVRRRELEADLLQNSTSVVAGLAETRARSASLAKLTAELADLAGGRPAGAGRARRQRLQAEAQALAERAEQAASGERLATVFVQYGKSVAPEVARAVAETPPGRRVRRPERGPDAGRRPRGALSSTPRTATPRRARRPRRRPRSPALGFPDLAVEVRDFTGWDKAKPRAGTLELWLALPEAKSG